MPNLLRQVKFFSLRHGGCPGKEKTLNAALKNVTAFRIWSCYRQRVAVPYLTMRLSPRSLLHGPRRWLRRLPIGGALGRVSIRSSFGCNAFSTPEIPFPYTCGKRRLWLRRHSIPRVRLDQAGDYRHLPTISATSAGIDIPGATDISILIR